MQLGANLAAARRVIENLTGEGAHVPDVGGTVAEDIRTTGTSTMTQLWKHHKHQELEPGPGHPSQNLYK